MKEKLAILKRRIERLEEELENKVPQIIIDNEIALIIAAAEMLRIEE